MIAMLVFQQFYERRKAGDERCTALNALMAEVRTGEGKSVVIQMLALYFVKAHGKRIHILENNEGLLQRDFEDAKKFFELFKKEGGEPITCSNNLYDDDADICYCLASAINGYYMNTVKTGSTGLGEVIMIVSTWSHLCDAFASFALTHV